MLAWGMLSFGEGYNKSDAWSTGVQTLRWNTDYLLKTIKDNPTDTATSVSNDNGGEEFYIVYQVGFFHAISKKTEKKTKTHKKKVKEL